MRSDIQGHYTEPVTNPASATANTDPDQHVQQSCQAVGDWITRRRDKLRARVRKVDGKDGHVDGHQCQACQTEDERRSRHKFAPRRFIQ